MVKDFILMGVAYTALILLYLVGIPFILISGLIKYIDKIWSE